MAYVGTRMVVLGGGGVGKSSLTIRFAQGHFTNFWDPTIEDTYRLQVNVDGESSMVQILDTAGQEEYYCMRDSWVRSGECFVLAFSYTSRASFDEIDLFLEHVLRVKDAFNGEVPMVLVGNKVDLEGEFQVTFAEAEQKARDLGCPLINASAKTAVNVTESFHECVRVNREKTEARPRTAKPSKRLFITRAASGFCSSCMRLLKLLPVLG